MTWQTLYLKTDTALDLVNALPQLRTKDETGKKCWQFSSPSNALDIIGSIDGVSGYHANLRCTPDIAGSIPPSIIVSPDPETPQRVWA